MAEKWANWLCNACRRAGPQRFRAWEEIRSGPPMDRLATSPLSFGGGLLHLRAWEEIRSDPQMGRLATSPLSFGGGVLRFRA